MTPEMLQNAMQAIEDYKATTDNLKTQLDIQLTRCFPQVSAVMRRKVSNFSMIIPSDLLLKKD